MKIFYLNFLKGANENDRYKRIVDYIKSQDPDLVLGCEMNRWQENNFQKARKFVKQIGYKKFVFGLSSRTEYHVAVFSKEEISKNEKECVELRNASVSVKI